MVKTIPRILHQIYLRGELPTLLANNVEGLKARNPGWDHRLYDAAKAEAFVLHHYGPEMLRCYRRIDPLYGAARADFLRHLIIFREGGVYCDIKSTFERPLDEVLDPDDQYLLAQWRNGPGEPHEGWGLHWDLGAVAGGELISYFVIGVPGHPFSEAVIGRIKRNIGRYRPWSAVGRTGVLRTTGPIAYTLAIAPILAHHPHRMTTEDQLGARPSIGEGYDHGATFTNHYSSLTIPVIRLGRMGRRLSRAFVALRSFKDSWLSRRQR